MHIWLEAVLSWDIKCPYRRQLWSDAWTNSNGQTCVYIYTHTHTHTYIHTHIWQQSLPQTNWRAVLAVLVLRPICFPDGVDVNSGVNQKWYSLEGGKKLKWMQIHQPKGFETKMRERKLRQRSLKKHLKINERWTRTECSTVRCLQCIRKRPWPVDLCHCLHGGTKRNETRIPAVIQA
jgi:hypothetical protein